MYIIGQSVLYNSFMSVIYFGQGIFGGCGATKQVKRKIGGRGEGLLEEIRRLADSMPGSHVIPPMTSNGIFHKVLKKAAPRRRTRSATS